MGLIRKIQKTLAEQKVCIFVAVFFMLGVIVLSRSGGSFSLEEKVNKYFKKMTNPAKTRISQMPTTNKPPSTVKPQPPSTVKLQPPSTVKQQPPSTVKANGNDNMTKQPSTIQPVTSRNANQSKTPAQCYSDYLGPSQADDLAKIESYKFEGIEEYIKDLFPSKDKEKQANVIQKYPTFVGGFSSNHFKEGQVMLDVLNETVRTNYPEARVIVFDLGLTKPQIEQLKTTCLCEIRKFEFEKYPEHVRSLRNFAWKAIAIQTVVKDYSFVVWMDTSIRFKTKHLDGLFKEIQEKGLLVTYFGKSNIGTITERTHLKTFEFLDENPCTYATHQETQGGFVMLYANYFITKYFLYPYVACALKLGCMEPFKGASDKFIHCPDNKKDFQYHLCHRSDQSMVGILYHRLFHKNPENNKIDFKYFTVCKDLRRIC